MSWIPYKDHIEKRRHEAFVAGANFGVQIDPQFTVMAVDDNCSDAYYEMVILEFRQYHSLDKLDEMLESMGLEEYDE